MPVRGKQLDKKDIRLKDSTGVATVALWDNLTSQIKTGDSIKMTGCRVRLFGAKKLLSSTIETEVEVSNTSTCTSTH